MALTEQLLGDQNAALRAGDSTRLSAIRFLRYGIQLEEKSKGQPLTDDQALQILSRQIGERRESIRAFEAGNRHDLADKEKAELAILESYQPEQLTIEELTDIVRKLVAELGASGAQDKGKVMGRLMPQIRGKADGAQANDIVTRLLSGEM